MKGFVCDRCGKTQKGTPRDRLPGETELGDIKQFVFLKIELVGGLPTPDLCDECKVELAEKAIETAKVCI